MARTFCVPIMYISNKTEVRKEDILKGKGRFAVENIVKDEVLVKFVGKIVSNPSGTSIQVGFNKHLEKPATYFNHSCNANTYINYDDLTMRSLRPISPGEEITFNYNSTEYDMKESFKCGCGSENCLKIIRGFKHLSKEQQKNIKHLAPYLDKMINQG